MENQRVLPALPRVTPHTLRRSYISIVLVANGSAVKWVMSQVGHADSKVTLDIYAQLEQRVERATAQLRPAAARTAR